MLHTILSYCKYWLRAKDEHSLHSPFLFEFYTQVIQNQKYYYIFDEIEALRENLITDTRSIEMEDYGTGAKGQLLHRKRVAEIASRSLKPQKLAALLFKMVEYFRPKNIIELGTSLGTTTLYLASPVSKAQVYTFEGSKEVAKIAKENFDKFGLQPKIQIGNIDHTLPNFLGQFSETLDFVYFDANHAYEPTLRYFEICLQKTNENTVFIFDDIYWSEGMTKAWEAIVADPRVKISLDLFDFGIVFFRDKQPKQHFVLKF